MKNTLLILFTTLSTIIYAQSDSIRYKNIADNLQKKYNYIEQVRENFTSDVDTNQKYTKKQFNSLMPFEKVIVKRYCKQHNYTYPIWKDTTIQEKTKFKVHQYALQCWEDRETRRTEIEKLFQETVRNTTTIHFYYTLPIRTIPSFSPPPIVIFRN